MRLASRMTLGIVSITLLAQLVFGILAYWMSREAEQRSYARHLERQTSEIARDIELPLAVGDLTRSMLELSRQRYAPGARLAVLRKRGGDVLLAGPSALLETDGVLEQGLLSLFVRPEKSGNSLLDGHTVLWSRIELHDLPYSLLLLENKVRDENGIFSSLGSRFLAVGLVITWISVWVALILSSIISRQFSARQQELKNRVGKDPLTGLPNRQSLLERLQSANACDSCQQCNAALLVIDIDYFKEINDTLGHELGDQLLLTIAERLTALAGETGWVARQGGDEFAVLFEVNDLALAQSCAKQIVENLHQPIKLDEMELEVSASIGIATCGNDEDSPGSLLRHANVALRQAKETGGTIVSYIASKDTSSVRRLRLAAQLRGAVERREMVLHYQPKIDLANGKWLGLETLVRWQHPELGLIWPDEFIGLAEQTGSIKYLTPWVIDKGLEFLASLHKQGLHVDLAVNISVANLKAPLFADQLVRQVDRSGIPHHCLTLEITETVAVHDQDKIRRVLSLLHDAGFRIAVDDFGTGFSSLSLLKDLPIDEIKIDRSFVGKMAREQQEETIVGAVVDLAHSLGYRVVAEGIEDQDTLNKLRMLACDIGQGYLFSKPLSAESIMNYVSRAQPEEALRPVISQLAQE